MNTPLDTLWYTHSPVPTGLGIAVESGRLAQAFRPWGTRIQALRESSDREVREAHFDHHLRNSVRHGGNIPAIWARASGRDTRVLGLSWSDEVQLIVSAPDSGVRSIRDLRHRRFGLPKWANVQIDFTRAQSLRGLQNALRLEGLEVRDVELVDYPYGGTYSDDPVRHVFGAQVALKGNRVVQRNNELIGLLRGDIDAIFLKGAHGLQLAHEFGLHVVLDVGSHPEPLVRSNIGTPRTLTVVSAYIHSGQAGTPKMDEKYAFLDRVTARLGELAEAGGLVVVAGDLNIAHRNVDIKNWKGNLKSAGFLPEERAYLDRWFDDLGWTDLGRRLGGDGPGPYTWWSWRGQAFDNDAGWRIDYQLTTPDLTDAAVSIEVDRAAAWDERWSDHAPLVATYDL